MQTNKPNFASSSTRKGMSVVLRVIVTGVVLIMIAMAVVFIGTGGLQRVAGPHGQTQQALSTQEKITICRERVHDICRGTDGVISLSGSTHGRSMTVGADDVDCSTALGYPKYNCKTMQPTS